MTDDEIMDDFVFYDDLIKKQSNVQCMCCGGWALYCPCKDGLFADVKNEVIRYLELTEDGYKAS